MRSMQHNSRASGGRTYSAKHNDRQFDVDKADNIDKERMKQNRYQNCYGDPKLTFEQVELKFYKENFTEQLDATNANYIKNRHPERCQKMEQWKRLKRYCPEETTLQIGKTEEHVDRKTLLECYDDYRKKLDKWNDEHGNPFTILTSALHCDEAVPHFQDRRVWHYTDPKTGIFMVGQERALELAGVELPHPGEKKFEGRRNNRKMTFDKMIRDMWFDTLEEHGLNVEREAVPGGKHNRSKEKMIRDKYEEMLQKTEDGNRELERMRTEEQEIKDKISALHDQENLLEGSLSRKKSFLEDVNQAVKDEQQEFTRLLSEQQNLGAQLADLERQKEDLTTEISNFSIETERLRQELEAMKKEKNGHAARSKKAKAEADEAEKEAASSKKKAAEARKEVAVANQKKEATQAEIASLERKKDSLTSKTELLEQEILAQQNEIDRNNETIREQGRVSDSNLAVIDEQLEKIGRLHDDIGLINSYQTYLAEIETVDEALESLDVFIKSTPESAGFLKRSAAEGWLAKLKPVFDFFRNFIESSIKKLEIFEQEEQIEPPLSVERKDALDTMIGNANSSRHGGADDPQRHHEDLDR